MALTAFQEARSVEAASWRDLEPFIRAKSYEGRFVVTEKGNLSEFLQRSVGDILFNSDESTVWSIELKCEEEQKHDNFFLETWSNRSRYTPGWMFTLNCDFLFYYFRNTRTLYSIRFPLLREWAFVRSGTVSRTGRLWEYPEKRQTKYSQLNDTWGRCVPIAVIKQQVGFTVRGV